MNTGLESLLVKVGLSSLKPKKTSDDEESSTARTVATTGLAGALPFAGLIGQQKMLHRPDKMPQAGSLEDLRAHIQDGDTLITGSGPGKSLDDFLDAKGQISLSTGTPEGYHVGVARSNPQRPGKFQMVHSHPAHGVSLGGLEELNGRVTVLRPQMAPTEMAQYLNNLDSDLAMGKQITKTRSGNAQLRDQVWDPSIARAGLYDKKQGIRAGLKELFLPKLKSQEAIEASRQQARAARSGFNAPGAKSYLDDLASAFHDDISGTDANAFMPKCVGSVCSTLPAGALPKGRSVVPGKLVNDVLPSDYLRSPLMKPVVHFNPESLSPMERALQHGPMAARLLGGGALMAGTYGLNKLYDKWRSRKAPARPISADV